MTDATQAEALRACPFCGEEGRPVELKGRGIRCDRCKAWGPDPDSRFVRWDKRPVEAALLARAEAAEADAKGWQSNAETALAACMAAEAQLADALYLLKRYRQETPTGNQPSMIAASVDDLLARAALTATETQP